MNQVSSYKNTLCPMTYVLDILGDKWSFLIIRDMLFKSCCRNQQFIDSDEGMATNILADRLKKLQKHGLIEQHRDPLNGRRKIYHLTTKGLDLTPAILKLIQWSGKYDTDTVLTEEIKEHLANNFEASVSYVKSQYQLNDFLKHLTENP